MNNRRYDRDNQERSKQDRSRFGRFSSGQSRSQSRGRLTDDDNHDMDEDSKIQNQYDDDDYYGDDETTGMNYSASDYSSRGRRSSPSKGRRGGVGRSNLSSLDDDDSYTDEAKFGGSTYGRTGRSSGYDSSQSKYGSQSIINDQDDWIDDDDDDDDLQEYRGGGSSGRRLSGYGQSRTSGSGRTSGGEKYNYRRSETEDKDSDNDNFSSRSDRWTDRDEDDNY